MAVVVFPLRLRHIFSFARLKREIESSASHLVVSGGERRESGLHILARMIISRRKLHTLIAADESGFLGYVSLVFPRFRKLQGNAYLTISVKDSCRGKGIGTLLMKSAESFARAHGARRIELDVLSKNTGAVRLYERLGYVTEGRRSQAVQDMDGFDDVVMMAKFL
jgi:ribosomal protein S18 acetylase RimI-like enzyme